MGWIQAKSARSTQAQWLAAAVYQQNKRITPFVLCGNVILLGIEIKTFAPTIRLIDESYSMASAFNNESIGTAKPHGRIYL